MKERQERERKEMKECMKELKKGKEKEGKKAAPTGLERVKSPCSCEQAKKKKKSKECSMKMAYIDTLPNRLVNTESSVFMRWENKPFDVLVDRTFSTIRLSPSDELIVKESTSNQWRRFWNFTGDDGPGLESELPLPVVHENPAGAEDNCYGDWFIPWFGGSSLKE